MHADPDELCGVEAVRKDWIDDLVRKLQTRIDLEALFLFGSRAKDEHTTWSDYDVCVVSPDFQFLKPWERMEVVLACWEGARDLEAVCFTPEEFETGRFSLMEEIRRHGLRLLP